MPFYAHHMCECRLRPAPHLPRPLPPLPSRRGAAARSARRDCSPETGGSRAVQGTPSPQHMQLWTVMFNSSINPSAKLYHTFIAWFYWRDFPPSGILFWASFMSHAFFLTSAKANRGFQPHSQTHANAIDAVETGCPGSGIRWLSGGSLVATEPRRARSTHMFLFVWFEKGFPLLSRMVWNRLLLAHALWGIYDWKWILIILASATVFTYGRYLRSFLPWFFPESNGGVVR